jgi:SET domain-containing protein
VRLSHIGAIAGDGLYVEHDVLKGEIVCEYTGDVYATHEAMRLEDKSYLMRLGEQCYVDAAKRLDVKARYINDCRHSLLYNVRFDKRPSEKRAMVVAVRDISAGEELFVDYGWKYWLSIKGKRLPPTIAAKILSDIEGDGKRKVR